jgi:hypothetical protein
MVDGSKMEGAAMVANRRGQQGADCGQQYQLHIVW